VKTWRQVHKEELDSKKKSKLWTQRTQNKSTREGGVRGSRDPRELNTGGSSIQSRKGGSKTGQKIEEKKHAVWKGGSKLLFGAVLTSTLPGGKSQMD